MVVYRILFQFLPFTPVCPLLSHELVFASQLANSTSIHCTAQSFSSFFSISHGAWPTSCVRSCSITQLPKIIAGPNQGMSVHAKRQGLFVRPKTQGRLSSLNAAAAMLEVGSICSLAIVKKIRPPAFDAPFLQASSKNKATHLAANNAHFGIRLWGLEGAAIIDIRYSHFPTSPDLLQPPPQPDPISHS